jgi:hypothetical protein
MRPVTAYALVGLAMECAAGRTLDPEQVLTALGPVGKAAGRGQAAGSGEAVSVLTARELDVLRLVAARRPGVSLA